MCGNFDVVLVLWCICQFRGPPALVLTVTCSEQVPQVLATDVWTREAQLTTKKSKLASRVY